jgi:F0F1-type ATP synthase epsilon subunit
VGYQPTLATDMGMLQERITSTRNGSITSVQAIYVPADDLTDPAPATSFAHLDATTVLSRAISELGIYPAWTRSTPTRASSTRWWWAASTTRRRAPCRDPAALQVAPGHHRHPRDGRAVGGGQGHRGPAPKIQRFLSQPFDVAQVFTGSPGVQVPLEETIASFKAVVTASTTTCPRRLLHGRRHQGGRRQGRAPRGGGGLTMADAMQFDLVSPERRLSSLSAREVQIPGSDGDLDGDAGPRADDHDAAARGPARGARRRAEEFVVSGGFAEVTGSSVSVLAEQAVPRAQLSAELHARMVEEAQAAVAAAQGSSRADELAKTLADVQALRA